jgi:hypothetical protein
MRRRHRTKILTRRKQVLNSYNRMVAHYAYLQASSKWSEWTYRTISLRQAENLVAAGEVERVTRMVDGAVQTVGFRALKPTSWEHPSPATLTFATMIAVGNADGRLTRREEMEVIKFRLWPLIGDNRAIRVGPAMTPAERLSAEKLLATGKLQAA